MAITCPQCAREYDATLFQFGRTIHCTCGVRVGGEPWAGSIRRHGEPRFIVDAMLGRLARWLRVLGYDAAYEAEIEDAELVRRALREGRIILTRDRSLPQEWRMESCLVVEGERPLHQVRQVVEIFDLRWEDRLFSRCTVCNARLESASRHEVAGRVPPYVWEHHEAFARCPSCGRIYWKGSHVHRMRRRLRRALSEERS